MLTYPEDFDVTLQVPFVDLQGLAITPLSVSVSIYDTEEVELVDLGEVTFAPGATFATVIIPAAYNCITTDEVREGRIVFAKFELAAGITTSRLMYVIQSDCQLVVMGNSFMSYEAAMVESINFSNMIGWETATEIYRRNALVEAFRRITNIPMMYHLRDSQGMEIECEVVTIGRNYWSEISQDAFTAFPTHLKRALRRAQFQEANEILLGEITKQKHRSGITSETIGESSVTLKAGFLVDSLAPNTLAALAGYIDRRIRLARA